MKGILTLLLQPMVMLSTCGMSKWYAYTRLNTPTHSRMHVLMYIGMGGCTGGMASIGQMPAGKPTVLSLGHWEPHGSVHKVAADIKECRDCSRTGTKGNCNPEVL